MLKQAEGFFTVKDVLDLTKMICAENWKVGVDSLVPFIEAAFAKSSL